jgi:hypothetical protein
MSLATQATFSGMEEYKRREPTLSELYQLAVQNNAGIEILERITAMMREERTYQMNVGFDEALNRCQTKMGRISTDANNPQTHSRYATYAKLDSVLRPIYTSEGFSLSFGERDCPTPGKTRFVAFLSRSGLTREYLKDMTASTKGPKGNDVMTPVHAEGALDSYARRYLLKSIFNVAIGEDDTDGNVPQQTKPEDVLEESVVLDFIAAIEGSRNFEEYKANYEAAMKAGAKDPYALRAFNKAKVDTWKANETIRKGATK